MDIIKGFVDAVFKDIGGVNLSKFSMVFKFIIIGIIYLILFLALKIMYKDIKNGGKKKQKVKALGLEVVDKGENNHLKVGSVIPINSVLTIGRRDTNLLVLVDPYVSSNHAKIYIKNNEYVIEDLNSTNGTVLNEKEIKGKAPLKVEDEIKIGSALFKVIG